MAACRPADPRGRPDRSGLAAVSSVATAGDPGLGPEPASILTPTRVECSLVTGTPPSASDADARAVPSWRAAVAASGHGDSNGGDVA